MYVCMYVCISMHSFVNQDEIWSQVVLQLSDMVLKFVINAVQNTLPHNVNLKHLQKSESDHCPLCGNTQTLLHVLLYLETQFSFENHLRSYHHWFEAWVAYITTDLNNEYALPAPLSHLTARPRIAIWNLSQCSRQNRQYRQFAGWGSQVLVEGRKTAYIAGCSGH